MDSALGFNHLNDTQSRFLQNLLCFTTNWQHSQIQTLRSYIYFHFTIVKRNLHDATVLTCFAYLSQVPHVLFTCTAVPELMQDLQINSLSREIHKGVMVAWKDIKQFHKFIDSCGLIQVHTPREKQYSNRNYLSFFDYLLYWSWNSRVHNFATQLALFVCWESRRYGLQNCLPEMESNRTGRSI
jgi:hypothetical protein